MKNRGISSVKASVPASIRRFNWVRNHHYVEMEDEQGNTVKLLAGGVLRGECTECRLRVYVETEQGAMVCPHCTGKVKWAWHRAQLAFLPEEESRFRGFDAPDRLQKPMSAMQRAWLLLYAALTGGSSKTPPPPSPDEGKP